MGKLAGRKIAEDVKNKFCRAMDAEYRRCLDNNLITASKFGDVDAEIVDALKALDGTMQKKASTAEEYGYKVYND